MLTLPLGDLTSAQARALADLARKYAGSTYEQLAVETRRSVSALKMTLLRTRDELRDCIEGKLGGAEA